MAQPLSQWDGMPYFTARKALTILVRRRARAANAMRAVTAAADAGPDARGSWWAHPIRVSTNWAGRCATIAASTRSKCACARTSARRLGSNLNARHSRTCGALPLVADESRPRIDYVVLVASMRSAHSAAFVRQSAEALLDAALLLEHACVLATHAAQPAQFAVERSTLRALADDCGAPLVSAALDDALAAQRVAAGVVARAAVAARRSGVSVPLMRSLDAAADIHTGVVRN